jgi:hypothetical protein
MSSESHNKYAERLLAAASLPLLILAVPVGIALCLLIALGLVFRAIFPGREDRPSESAALELDCAALVPARAEAPSRGAHSRSRQESEASCVRET